MDQNSQLLEIPKINAYRMLSVILQTGSFLGSSSDKMYDLSFLCNLIAVDLLEAVKLLEQMRPVARYTAETADLSHPRGRIDFLTSYTSGRANIGKLTCEFDEISSNKDLKILYSMAFESLLSFSDLQIEIRKSIQQQGLGHLSGSGLNWAAIKTVGLFVERQGPVAEKVYYISLFVLNGLDEHPGDRPHDEIGLDIEILRIDRLWEKYCKFYFQRLDQFVARARRFPWQGVVLDNASDNFIPEISTDLVIDCKNMRVVVDAKCTKDPFPPTQYSDAMLRAGHINQIFAYIHNISKYEPDSFVVGGMLLYGCKSYFHRSAMIGKHVLHAIGIDITGEWKKVEQKMLDIKCTVEKILTVESGTNKF